MLSLIARRSLGSNALATVPTLLLRVSSKVGFGCYRLSSTLIPPIVPKTSKTHKTTMSLII